MNQINSLLQTDRPTYHVDQQKKDDKSAQVLLELDGALKVNLKSLI